VNEDAANRLRERRIMLIVWTGCIAVIFWIGSGFAGGLAVGLEDNPLGWAFVLSPLIPLALWLKARRDYARSVNGLVASDD
jgi:hypothetical protein